MITMIDLACDTCGSEFSRRKAQYESSVKQGRKGIYCKPSCVQTPKKQIERVCEHCGSTFLRRKAGGADRLKYCSRPCSNRGRSGKFKVAKTVCVCGGRKHGTAKLCSKCSMELRRSATLQELRDKYRINEYHTVIRGYARLDYLGSKSCAVCEYSLHVDICHLVGVKDFPMSATLAEVNASDNLAALCKNHHWEYDNGYLELKDGKWLPSLK